MTDASQKSRSRDSSDGSSAFWRTQEMLLIQQIMGRIGKGLQIEQILREMLQLMSEMLGLNRGRIVLFEAPST